MIDLKELREKYESMMSGVVFGNYRYCESINQYMIGSHTIDHEYKIQWLMEINFGWRVFQMCNGVPEDIITPFKSGLKAVFDENGKARLVETD